MNDILDFYKTGTATSNITININNKRNILKKADKDFNQYIYEVAAYYTYLIEIEKYDLLDKLRDYLYSEKEYNKIKVRSRYFIYRFFQKVEELPYSRKSKDKILNIYNYILNYRFNNAPFIPINIIIYSKDKDSINNIKALIGNFMWFFGYLPDDMRYYDESMNNIVLDKYSIQNLYWTKTQERLIKRGILVLHNFENIMYTEAMNQNLILNVLTDEMDKNKNYVCTIIYGDKEELSQILNGYPKLKNVLINVELELDELDAQKATETLVKKLEQTELVPNDVENKIYNYIKSTYNQSDTKNMEYINKLYNSIILNKYKAFDDVEDDNVQLSHIPDAYSIRDISDILKDLNSLVGLHDIKEQITDLIHLLKFNQKANINISNFNLHMIFTGNPGTGKTTVARLVSDILYNLGYINQNKLVEVSSKDLIAEYVGQTAGKTYKVLKSAIGGVLFIDEAYAIVGEGSKFGDECISTILKMMEDYKENLVIIFAGYKEEMNQFAKSNVGLTSRIGYTINFPDYTIDELMEIFLNLLKKDNLSIDKEAENIIKEIIERSSTIDNFGNGRYVNNLFQKLLISHAKNLDKIDDFDLYKISKEDIEYDKLLANNLNNNKKIGF